MAKTTYERVQELLGQGYSQAKIADEIGCSRQYVGQLLERDGPPGPSSIKHGTTTMAATCSCAACAEVKARLQAAMPEVSKRLRAGETLRAVVDMTGLPVGKLVTAGRRDIAAGRPTILAELVAVVDETAHMRPLGRPALKRAA